MLSWPLTDLGERGHIRLSMLYELSWKLAEAAQVDNNE